MTYGQWQEELLEELGVQAELAQDALSILWAPRWATLLMQWLWWDPLRPSAAQVPAGTSGLARDQGAPTVVEGEILPEFSGVAVP